MNFSQRTGLLFPPIFSIISPSPNLLKACNDLISQYQKLHCNAMQTLRKVSSLQLVGKPLFPRTSASWISLSAFRALVQIVCNFPEFLVMISSPMSAMSTSLTTAAVSPSQFLRRPQILTENFTMSPAALKSSASTPWCSGQHTRHGLLGDPGSNRSLPSFLSFSVVFHRTTEMLSKTNFFGILWTLWSPNFSIELQSTSIVFHRFSSNY